MWESELTVGRVGLTVKESAVSVSISIPISMIVLKKKEQ